jgi:hypothetical protein
MILNGKNVVVLYLEDWQIKMIKDFLHVDCYRWEVPIEDAKIMRYGSPVNPPVQYKRMYLTDWQMRELKDEAGMTCDFIELKKAIYMEYGVPLENSKIIQSKN